MTDQGNQGKIQPGNIYRDWQITKMDQETKNYWWWELIALRWKNWKLSCSSSSMSVTFKRGRHKVHWIVWVDWTMVFHKKPFPGQVYILEMAAVQGSGAVLWIYDGIATGTHHNCQRLNNLITRFDPSRDPGPEPQAGVSFILRRKLAAERRREVQRSGV